MNDESNHPYDVFISYRWTEPDQSWVRSQFAPALEKAGLNVLLDVDDFVPGRSLVREMERGGNEARRAVCVISPDYFTEGRLVNFEESMLLLNDPSGAQSRLIPFILRPTNLPARIRALIPLDWTDTDNHQREWRKLLQVLEAKNPEAPPPGPLLERDVIFTPPLPAKPFPYRLVIPILAIILLISVGAFLYMRRSKVKTIEGTIYFQPKEHSLAHDPANNVVVCISQRPDLKSDPTGPDGKFVIRGIPADFKVTQLIATRGAQDFPVAYQEAGVYAIIPRPEEQNRDVRFVTNPWREIPISEDCEQDDPQQFLQIKQYVLEMNLQPEQGKREALLTVDLTTVSDAVLLEEFVLSPTLASGLYENRTLPDKDQKLTHTWLFTIPQKGLNIKLELCVGLNDSAVLPQDHIHTYYELR